jgi:hypothetical protein
MSDSGETSPARPVNPLGDVVERSGRIFVALRKDGVPRRVGRLPTYHAVTPNCRLALCSAEPGNGSVWAWPPAQQITCQKCLRRLERI